MRAFTIIIPVLFLLNSCCSKSECVSSSPMEMSFLGYNSNEQELLVETYYKNGQFDSLITQSTENITLTSSNKWNATFIEENYDYRITLMSDNSSFTISGLEVNTTATLKKCGPFRTKEALVCPWGNITVNGSKAQLVDRTIVITQ